MRTDDADLHGAAADRRASQKPLRDNAFCSFGDAVEPYVPLELVAAGADQWQALETEGWQQSAVAGSHLLAQLPLDERALAGSVLLQLSRWCRAHGLPPLWLSPSQREQLVLALQQRFPSNHVFVRDVLAVFFKAIGLSAQGGERSRPTWARVDPND